MKKFDLFDFDLTGGMTDREFKDTLGAVSAFCIYEDATGIHNAGVKASLNLFYSGTLADKEPTAIIAIGAGVTNLASFVRGQNSIKRIYGKSWDTSKITSMSYAFMSCGNLEFVDCNNWDTSALTAMDYAFNSCASLKTLDLSKWDTSLVTYASQLARGCTSLYSIGLPTIPSGCSTSNMFYLCEALKDVYFGEGCKVYPSLSFSDCPLTYQSVCNVLDALADTPDEGATITFKSGLYAGFTEEQQAVIDGKVADVVANGWTIVNMGA